MRKRTGVLGWLLVGLLCIMAAGCSGPVQAPVSESQRIIQEQTENMEETEHRPVVIETEPEPETEAQEPVKGNVIQQRTETDGMIHSYLTGELVPAEQGKRRPLAVMMSNDRAALPQYGLNRAGVIYEVPVEAGMNRYMALIENFDDLERIGSVRSCRTYYVYFAREFDGIYAHFGQSTFAKPYLKYIDNINGIDGTDTKLFVADDNAGYASGQEWKEYTYTFNTKDCTKLYIDIYKYVGESSVSISDLRLYEKSQYNQYEEEEKEEAAEEENKKYTEVWRDDFDTLDTSTWSYQLGHKRGIEPQDYVSNKDNVFVEDGKLYLRATEKDEYRVHYNADGSDIVKKYDSGSIATFGKKEFLYGKIEMRAKLPKGAGAFPAFWTLGNDFTLDGLVDSKQGVGWPMCGEIDIMELIGANPDVSGTSDSTVHGTIHNGLTENGDKAQTNTYSLKEGTFNDDYHTFGIVWNPDTIEWYVDGNVYSTIYITDLDYFQKPHYLLFNLAAGGAWPGFPNEDTEFPMDFVIDYVSYSQTAAQKEAADKYYATAPTFSGVKDITISDESQLSSLMDHVKATDANGKALDVSCSINDGQKLMWNGRTRTSEIDFSKQGTYEIVYSTIGENNVYTRACATLHVK